MDASAEASRLPTNGTLRLFLSWQMWEMDHKLFLPTLLGKLSMGDVAKLLTNVSTLHG
jgi:hypothetical protein